MSFYESENLTKCFSNDEVREQTLAEEDVLFRAGEPVSRIFFIVSGEVRAESYLEDGTAIVFFRARNGQAIAEEGLHLPNYLYSAVVSRKDTVVRSVSRDLLQSMLQSQPEVMDGFIQCLSHRYSDALMYRELISIKSAEERLMMWLQWQVSQQTGRNTLDFEGRMGSISSDLGLSKEAVYRAFKSLEDKGKLTRDHGLVTLPPLT